MKLLLMKLGMHCGLPFCFSFVKIILRSVFFIQTHMSLKHSNSVFLSTLTLRYEYCYLRLLIKAINFKAQIPQYIRCGIGKNHT
jgi:hypothetical protein